MPRSTSLAALSATKVWAAGGTSWFDPSQTLIEHWNGRSWSQVPSPTPDGTAYLNGVAAITV